MRVGGNSVDREFSIFNSENVVLAILHYGSNKIWSGVLGDIVSALMMADVVLFLADLLLGISISLCAEPENQGGPQL